MARFTQKQYFLIWLGAVALISLFGSAGLRLTDERARLAVSLVTFLSILLVTQFMLAFLLYDALHTHFYSYASVALIGGILFAGLFALSVAGYLLFAIGRPEILSSSYLSEIFMDFPRRFSYSATFVISAISAAVIVSNIALMRHEGFHPKNALGVLLGSLYFGTTVGMYLLTDWLRDTFYSDVTGFDAPLASGIYTFLSLTLLVSLCYFECAFLGFVCMNFFSARRQPRPDKDFIIIPGCRVRRDGTPTPLLKSRADRAILFVRRQQALGLAAPRLIPSGGKGPDEPVSEGESLAAYLKEQGIPVENILPECASFTTEQNMRYSRAVAEANGPTGSRFAFSTSDYHVFRSGICAAEAGLDAEGMASDTKWYFRPNGTIREFFAILKLNVPAHIKAVVIITIVCACIGLCVTLGYLG